jgi:hypothetical protein
VVITSPGFVSVMFVVKPPLPGLDVHELGT